MDTAVSLKCPRCGAPVDIADSKTEMLSCPYCDATFKNPSYDPNAVAEAAAQELAEAAAAPHASAKSSKIAQLLCDFLGIWGVHRFYVGKIGTGLIWLFTGGCFFIGWIVDAITISKGRFTDSAGLPIINENSLVNPKNSQQMICSNCKSVVASNSQSCESCGVDIKKWWETTRGTVAIIVVLIALWAVFYTVNSVVACTSMSIMHEPAATTSSSPAPSEPSSNQLAAPSSSEPKDTTPDDSAKSTSTAEPSKTYQNIYDEYSAALKQQAPVLAEEYTNEAKKLSSINDKAKLSNDKVGELAKTCNDGVSEMAALHLSGTGDYETYQEWAQKLQDDYMNQAEVITDAYMQSAM